MDFKKFEIEYYGLSDIGSTRSDNQDSFGKFPKENLDIYSGKGQLFIVADGMGGHLGGKEASSIAVEKIKEIYFNSEYNDSLSCLKKAFEYANNQIFTRSEDSIELKGMGTTCSVLILKGENGIAGHIGDSRIYEIQNNKIKQITEDHTQANAMVNEGIISRKEAENLISRSILTRALGVDKIAEIDFIKNIKLKTKQYFIMCSDGLAKVNANEILEIVTNSSPKDSCEKLIHLANERGGKDNVTVIVIKINSFDSRENKQPVGKIGNPFNFLKQKISKNLKFN